MPEIHCPFALDAARFSSLGFISPASGFDDSQAQFQSPRQQFLVSVQTKPVAGRSVPRDATSFGRDPRFRRAPRDAELQRPPRVTLLRCYVGQQSTPSEPTVITCVAAGAVDVKHNRSRVSSWRSLKFGARRRFDGPGITPQTGSRSGELIAGDGLGWTDTRNCWAATEPLALVSPSNLRAKWSRVRKNRAASSANGQWISASLFTKRSNR